VVLPKAGYKVQAAEISDLFIEESEAPILSMMAGQHNQSEKRGAASPMYA